MPKRNNNLKQEKSNFLTAQQEYQWKSQQMINEFELNPKTY